MREPRLLWRLLGRTAMLVLMLVALTAVTAQAKTCYVDTGGNDAFNGLAPVFDGTDGPKRTIQAAIDDCAVAGDIISVETGTYAESVTVNKNLIFEARQAAGFTRVDITGGVQTASNANLTVRDNTEAGFTGGGFRLQNGIATGVANVTDPVALYIAGTSTLTIDDGFEGGRLQIAAQSPTGGRVVRNDQSNVVGTVTYNGAAHVFYVDPNNSDHNVTAGGELPSALEGGSLTVDIENRNTLTLTQQLSVGGAAVSVLSGDIEGQLVVNSGTLTLNGPGNAGSLTVNDGNVTVASSVGLDNVNVANVETINFNLAAGVTVSVTGNFNRQGGTFTAPSTASLAFIGGTNAVFQPGPNFAVGAVSVAGARTLQVLNNVDVTSAGDAFTVAAGTTVDLGSQTINVTGGGAVDMDGTQVNLATGGVVFSSAGSLRGDGTFGNLFIVTGGPDVVVTAGEEIEFAGILSLQAGGITVGAGGDISPTGNQAQVIVNAARADTRITGSFNADNVRFNLTYNGNIGGGTRAVGTEFSTNRLRNVTFNVSNGTLDASAAAGGTITGTVILTGVGDTGNVVTLSYTVELPAAATVTVEGNLTVGESARLSGDNTLLVLQGATNTVQGSIDTDVTTRLEGNLVGASAGDEFASWVGPVVVNANVAITNIQQIMGDLTVNANRTLNLTLADERQITGALAVNNGATLTLGSLVEVDGAVTLSGTGTVNFNTFNLIANAGFTAPSTATLASTGGALVFDQAGNLSLGGNTVPHLRVEDATVTLTSNAVIGNSLVETGAGQIVLGNNDLTIGGTLTSNGGTIITTAGTGMVIFNTTAATLSGNPTIMAPTRVATDATVTLASTTNTARTLTINNGALTLRGTLELGINNLVVAGGNNLVSDGGAIGGTGVVTVQGGDIEPTGGTFTIPNLTTTTGTVDVGVTTNGTLRITGTLRLETDLNENDADDHVVLASGATIVRAGGALQDAPAFDGTVDVVIAVASTAGNEFPVTATGGTLRNLTVQTGAPLELGSRNIVVTGTLDLAAAILEAAAPDATTDVTLASGSSVVLRDGADLSAPELAATDFNVTLAFTSNISFADAAIQQVFGISGATILTLTVNLGAAGTTLTMDQARTFTTLILDRGTLNLAGFNLSVSGNLRIDNAADAALVNTGALARLRFVGGNSQNFVLEAPYVVPTSIDVELAKTGSTVVTLQGGNVDLRQNARTLFLNGGILETMGNAAIVLFQSDVTQGFERTVAAGEASHIAGNVTKRLLAGDPFAVGRSARFEFPTGSPDGEYRPAALTFRTSVPTQTDITVNHEDVSPQGTLGLPVQSNGVVIGNYPDFYWLMRASTSLGQAQAFDVELTGTDIDRPFENVDDLRIIRRFDGSATTNAWLVQGTADNYDNLLAVDADGDTTAVVRVVNSTGGLVPQGARFTLGIPTRLPSLAILDELGQPIAVSDTTVTVAEADTLVLNFRAQARNVGETIELLEENLPAFATLVSTRISADTVTAVVTLAPDFGDAGTFPFTLLAATATDTARVNVTAIVTTTNQPPAFTSVLPDTSVSAGQTLTFDFEATDAEGDELTFSLVDAPDGASIDPESGVFTWTPTVEQSDSVFTITTVVSDGAGTDTTTAQVTVGEFEVLFGDVNLDGQVTAFDAVLVLQHVAGNITVQEGPLSPQQLIAADVSGNGTVSAFDAALILQFAAGIITEFPAEGGAGKTEAVASGTLGWGDTSTEGGVLALPITLSGTVRNVYAIEFTGRIDLATVKMKAVQSNLPEGWQVAYAVNEEGLLTVAMAGTTPLSTEGAVATLTFDLLEKSAAPSFTAEGFINENASVAFGEVSAREVPAEFALGNNYPNPFNPTTSISYQLPEAAQVVLEVYDVAGRLVQTLVNGQVEAGYHTVRWDAQSAGGAQVASGLYIYRIKAGAFVQTKTMLLVK